MIVKPGFLRVSQIVVAIPISRKQKKPPLKEAGVKIYGMVPQDRLRFLQTAGVADKL